MFNTKTKCDIGGNYFLLTERQVREPNDIPPVNGLSVTIQDVNGWQYVYDFTWDGDKLVEGKGN